MRLSWSSFTAPLTQDPAAPITMDPPKKQLAIEAKRKQPRPYQQIVRPEEKLVRIYKPREPRDRRYTAAVQLTASTRLPVLPTDIWRMVLKELVGPLVDEEGEAKEFRWAQAHLAGCMRVNKVCYSSAPMALSHHAGNPGRCSTGVAAGATIIFYPRYRGVHGLAYECRKSAERHATSVLPRSSTP